MIANTGKPEFHPWWAKPYAAMYEADYLHSMHSRGFYPMLLIVSKVDFELHPTVSLKEKSFNVLVAPREHFIEMLNCNLNLQRFEVLFVTGDFSGILSRLHRRFTELEIRQGFTTFQLMTILGRGLQLTNHN
ncbi:MAG: hypothetical protein LUQ22_04310 [Methanotrichaceae archaeon]|nr:hypothetical protein [Methanotrichaceae archaeon]